MTTMEKIKIDRLKGKKFRSGQFVYTVWRPHGCPPYEVLCKDHHGDVYGFSVTNVLNATEWVK